MKFKFWLWPLASVTVIFSSCSRGFPTNPQSLTELREIVTKNNELIETKKSLVEPLKKAFQANSTATTKLMLEAWKHTLERIKILEKPFDKKLFEQAFGLGKTKADIEPSASTKALRVALGFSGPIADTVNTFLKLDKQIIEDFIIDFKSPKDFKIQVRMSASGNYRKEDIKQYIPAIGINDADVQEQGTLTAKIIFTYTPPSQNFFSESNFDKLTSSIKFNTNLRLQIIGTDQLVQKLLDTRWAKGFADRIIPEQGIDLLPYIFYSIKSET